MSTADSNIAPAHGNGHAHHDPHLAHHFDTPEQQFLSAKLGMWVFLGTEILMFGGLFCAYSVYRHNHPDVFAYAHQALNRWLGAVNTIVLITSSLTMAWGVRAAQMGNTTLLRWLLGATIIGGFGFMGIKAVEYRTKWEHHLFVGSGNNFYRWDGVKEVHAHIGEGAEEGHDAPGPESHASPNGEKSAGPENLNEPKIAAGAKVTTGTNADAPALPPEPAKAGGNIVLPPGGAFDPNAGKPDEAKIVANWADPKGLSPKLRAEPLDHEVQLGDLNLIQRQRIYTFFGVYFIMTGLHGVHVVVGMALIYWILLRASGPRRRLWLVPAAPISVGLFLAYLGIVMNGSIPWIGAGVGIAVLGALWAVARSARFSRRIAASEGEFGPDFFTPVDLVGLYWHIVDLIWIFLFPLLYLIH